MADHYFMINASMNTPLFELVEPQLYSFNLVYEKVVK